MTTARINLELLQVAETVAREKNIDREEVIAAMEMAVQKAARAKYGHERDIRATIDRESGNISLALYEEVVEEVDESQTQISLKDARKKDPNTEIGAFIIESLPPIEFGRIAAQTAKQVIVQKVRDAERLRQYEEFKDRIGEVISGTVKRIDFGNLILDLGRAEAILRRDEMIPRETYRQGDRVRVYIYDVRIDHRGLQILLSRTRPEFMSKLFTQEVPEIYDGVIEVKAVARDPGSRAKIAVYSKDSSLDPVGACVGMRGSRVQAIVAELQGEKVDIVPWSQDTATFVINALAPSDPIKVVLDEDVNRIEVVVPDEQLSLAIGRRGQNVRLASALTGWHIDIVTESDESQRRTEDFKTRSHLFIEALDVDDVIAHLLVTEGFMSVEEILEVDQSELITIEGFDEDVAAELQNRARVFLDKRKEELQNILKEKGIDERLINLEGLSLKVLDLLVNKGIKTLDDLGDLATDELLELLPSKTLSHQNAEALIMQARAHWFQDDATSTQ
jgi:transcription termination/antitermination protein NusA